MNFLLLVLVLLLCYVVYQVYKTEKMPVFAIKTIEMVKKFANLIISKITTKKEGE